MTGWDLTGDRDRGRRPIGRKRVSSPLGRRRVTAQHRRVFRQIPREPLLSSRRMRRAVWAVTVVFAAVAFASLLWSPALYIRSVRVTGLASLKPGEAAATRSTVLIGPKTSILWGRWERSVRGIQRLPWVQSVRAERRFPSTLEFVVTPRTAHILLGGPAGIWELDRRGVAVRPGKPDTRLPLVVVSDTVTVTPGSAPEVDGLAAAIEIERTLRDGGPVYVTKIDIDPRGELCLNMSDSVAIRLGRSNDLEAKIASVRRIYENRPDIGSEVVSIDLRLPETPSCVLREAGDGPSQNAQGDPRAEFRTTRSSERQSPNQGDAEQEH